jgi:hypothetical protein
VFIARFDGTEPQPRPLSPADAQKLMGALDELRRTGSGDAGVFVRIRDDVRAQRATAAATSR